MKQFASYISTFRQQHSAHLSHLPSLEEAYGSICAICATLRVGDSPQLKYLIKKIQCRYLLEQLVQVNKAVLESAKGGNFTVVEALSRIAIEHAVNIIYVAEDEAHARAQSLLHHHVDGCHSRATAWKKYAVESGDEEALSIADRKIEQLNGFAFHSQSTVGSVDKWPSASVVRRN